MDLPFAEWSLRPCVSGLQYSLPALVTGMVARDIPLESAAKMWAGAPAQLASLAQRKGRLAVGYDADLVVRAAGMATGHFDWNCMWML